MHGTSGRLLRLLALLQAQRYWTGSELARRLEVTGRTVRRDIDRLRALGYPVLSSVGVAGGYQLGAGARLPPLLLDDDEALAVALGLRTAATGAVSGVEEAALRALGKLARVLPKRLRKRVQAMHSAVAPLTMAGQQADAMTLMELASAFREGHRASFRYEDRHGVGSLRVVEPHGLVHTGARWYLVAYDLDRDGWRTFRVDRIRGKVTAGARFAPREVPGGDTTAFVSQSVSLGAYALRAHILFHAPIERVSQRIPPWAGALRRISDDRCALESGASSLGALAFHIVTVGEEFEVKQPPELIAYVEVLAERLSRAAARAQGQPAAETASTTTEHRPARDSS